MAKKQHEDKNPPEFIKEAKAETKSNNLIEGDENTLRTKNDLDLTINQEKRSKAFKI